MGFLFIKIIANFEAFLQNFILSEIIYFGVVVGNQKDITSRSTTLVVGQASRGQKDEHREQFTDTT